jgi:translocation and assembly module TamB
MSDTKARRIGIRILKIFGWIIVSIVALLIVVAVAIQIPWVQNKIKQKAISFLESKIGTRVELEHFSLSFSKKIIIEGLYLEDQQKDTLLYAGRLGVDTDLWALTDNTIELNTIELENFTSTIKRSEKDSAFNFDYIIKAFVSDTVQADTTASAPWDFRLGDVELRNLKFYLSDNLSGNHVTLRLRELDISTEKFDLNNSEILFDNVRLAGLNAGVTQTKIAEALPDSVEVVPEDSAAVAMNIGFKTFALEDIQADYEQRALGQVASISIPEAFIEANTIDIKQQLIDLAKVSFTNTVVTYEQMATGKKVTQPESTAEPAAVDQEPWKLILAAIDLSGLSLQYHDYNKPFNKKALDFNHLWVSNLNSKVRNIKVTPEETRADVSNFSFRERSGFKVLSFRSALSLQQDSFALDRFYLKTGNSLLRMNASASFPSLEAVSRNIEAALFSLNVQSSSVSVRDALYFDPSALDSLPVELDPSATLRFDTYMHGSAKDLAIERLQLHALDKTSLFANGRISNVMRPEEMTFNINLDRLYTTRADLQMILPDTMIPPSVQVPSWLSLKGNYKGTIQAPVTRTVLTSEYGTVNLVANLDLNKGVKENYKGQLVVEDFHVGKLLKQPQQMGSIDMVAVVNGAGLTLEELDALFKVRVNRFQYSGYTYRDFKLDGSMKKYFFSGKASLLDENVNFVLTGDLDYTKEEPRYKMELDLRNMDFKKLKLTPRPLKAKGQLVVDLSTPDFQKLNGDIDIRKFAVFNGQKLYAVDSLLFASIDQEGQSEISIRSDILSGDFKGTINIFSLPDVLTRHFNRYFSLRDTVYTKPVDEQNFKFDLVIKNTDLITEILVPELEPFVPGKINGEFNSAEHRLKLNIALAEMNYSGIAVDSLSLRVISDPKSFDFTFSVHDLLVDTLNVKGIRLAGNVMNDSIRTNLMILDSLDQEKYFLGGVFHSYEDAFQFSFLKNHLILNYEEWDTPLYNSLRFTDAGLDPNNFLISKGEERILLLQKNNADSTLSLMFNNVDLKNLTSLVEGTTPVGGFMDGELTLASAEEGQFNTELAIRDLQLLEQHWGDLSFLMFKRPETPMNFKMGLNGSHAEIVADGFFGSGTDADVLIRGAIKKLDLAIAEPLTMGQLKELKGMLTGQITVMGKSKDPEIAGQFNLRNTSFLSTFTNTNLSIDNETIYLRDDDIVFDRFEVLDSKKNKAVLDGLVTSNPKGGLDLRLNLTAQNFQLFNTTAEDNELFYGKAWLNAKATISGNSFQPIIRMNVSLANESEVTYVVPQAEKGVMEQKGIVVFIDKDAVNDPFMASINPSDTVQSGYTGMDLTANIEFSDQEKFNVVIDPVTGDRLSVRGNSTLTLHMDPTGDMTLSGRYEITEGTYDLSFAKLVKRNFAIDKGSTIVWSGDPLTGQMDIRAIYTVETSPVDLVANQVSEDELNKFRKEVPFDVYLILKGELLFPEVSFRLDMKEDDRDEFGGNIYPKLLDINQQQSELNKQVFALLILKRFISDNPFESEAGGDLASSARKSVSKLLSEQLNRLSSNVKGVELSFDLKSYDDYQSGSAQAQTELQLGLSKSLMNDRLVVKVSGNVNVEGEANKQSSLTDYIGDLALEYKLTKDGRFRVTGFRNSNYDMIDGDLIETGAGLIYIKDYDSFRELFKPNDKKKYDQP